MSRLVRTLAFTRNELVTTLRQPRMLLTLVLGPFLILFLFGLGYQHDLPPLATLVVGNDDDLTAEVDAYIKETEPSSIDYRGTTQDRRTAMNQLRDGDIDLVIVLPENALQQIDRNRRAVIELYERTLDPLSSTQIWIAADAAVAEINDQVLARVIGNLQERTGEFTDELTTASDQLERIRSALDRDDAQTIQSVASTLANRFEDLADFLDRGGFIVGRLGLGEDAERYEESLRTGAELLRELSASDLPTRLDEAAATLSDLQEAAGELRDLNPQIAVTPFTSEVQSATPVRVTLTRYYAPGIVALMLQHIAITFAALSLVRERERGTTELLRAGPASLTERLTGKWVAFTLLGAALAAALTAAVMTAFGVPAPANWPLFVLLVLLVLTASVGYGYLVAAAASSDRQAVQFSMLLFLTTIFFAGLFMPLDRIDLPIEAISWLLPATYGTAGMQQLMLLQQDPQPLLLGGIAVMAVALFAAGRLALGILDRRR